MKKIIIPKPVRFFTDQDKHELIMDYLAGGQSKDAVWRKYTGKSDHGRLLKWMRDLGYVTQKQDFSCKIVSETDLMPKKKTLTVPADQDLEKLELKRRIQELEKQLKDAEYKAIAFSTMVEMAEKEFKIPIRKKFNTKP
jgi:transposase